MNDSPIRAQPIILRESIYPGAILSNPEDGKREFEFNEVRPLDTKNASF